MNFSYTLPMVLHTVEYSWEIPFKCAFGTLPCSTLHPCCTANATINLFNTSYAVKYSWTERSGKALNSKFKELAWGDPSGGGQRNQHQQHATEILGLIEKKTWMTKRESEKESDESSSSSSSDLNLFFLMLSYFKLQEWDVFLLLQKETSNCCCPVHLGDPMLLSVGQQLISWSRASN